MTTPIEQNLNDLQSRIFETLDKISKLEAHPSGVATDELVRSLRAACKADLANLTLKTEEFYKAA